MEILERMEGLSLENPRDRNVPHPDAKTYNMAMERLYFEGELEGVREVFDRCTPDPQSFVWRYLAQGKGGKKSRVLLEKMRKFNGSGLRQAVRLCAKEGDAEGAEELVKSMGEMAASGYEECRPDRSCFNDMVEAWSKSRHKDAMKRCREAIDLMVDLGQDLTPDKYTYNSLITAHMHCGSTPQETEEVLKVMEYCNIKPDKLTYSSIISSWARSARPEAGPRASALVEKAISANIPLDAVLFNNALYAWCRGSRTTQLESICRHILNKMNHLNISNDEFTLHLALRLLCRDPKACPTYADQILSAMELQRSQKTLQNSPCFHDYDNLSRVYLNHHSPEDAAPACESLLRRMLLALPPRASSYDRAILAWSRSSRPDRAARAHALFREAGDLPVDPLPVLRACRAGGSEGVSKALDVHLFCLENRPEAVDARHCFLLLGVAFGLDAGPRRNKLVAGIYKTCRERGLADGRIGDYVKENVPSALWKRISTNANVSKGNR